MTHRLEIPHIHHIVTRQLGRWAAQQRAQTLPEPRKNMTGGPYLTVSRQPGVGGEEWTRQLALQLQWKYYNRSILENMARQARLRIADLERVETGSHHPIQEAVQMCLDRNYPGQHTYLKQLSAMVSSLGTRGRVVIQGRGAHFLLPASRGVRIRLIADLEDRIGRVSLRTGWSREEASQWIEETTRNQCELIRNILHQDMENPLSYDLVLNTSQLDFPACRELIFDLLTSKLGIDAPDQQEARAS